MTYPESGRNGDAWWEVETLSRQQSHDVEVVPGSSARVISLILWFVGSGLVMLGTLLAYASNCTDCRILAPPGVAPVIWVWRATPPLVAVVAASLVALRTVATRRVVEYSVGIAAGVGLVIMCYFLPFAIHPGFPGGGTFGLGGLVGVCGGFLLLLGGLLLSPLGERAEPKANG